MTGPGFKEGGPTGWLSWERIKRAVGWSSPQPTGPNLLPIVSSEVSQVPPHIIKTEPSINPEETAKKLLGELDQKGRNARLALIVGTNAEDKLRKGLERQRDTVIHATAKDEDTLALYPLIRPMARRVPIILVVDSVLSQEGTAITGTQMADQIAAISRENAWRLPMLMLVGPGADIRPNSSHFRQTYRGCFLGSITKEADGREIADILREVEMNIRLSRPRRSELDFTTLDRMTQTRQESQTPEVQDALTELQRREGKKGLILIVDDQDFKQRDFLRKLEIHAQEASLGYVLRSVTDGAIAASFYRELRRLAPQQEIMLVLDGSLGSHALMRYGLDVADFLIQLARKQNWAPPLLIGGSSDRGPNQELADIYPKVYLGDLYHDKERALAAIDEKL